jgi:hypothetical protein
VSGHNPLRITFGEKPQFKDSIFRFEKWRLELDDLLSWSIKPGAVNA